MGCGSCREQDLPVDLQGRLLGESAEHTHEGDLVRETQRLDGKEDEIRRFLKLGVSKTAIAKLTGVSRTALYSFMTTRGLRPSR